MAEASPDAITSGPCHLDGITRLCFSPDGSTIFTGGVDSLVRIHKVDEPDSEPGFHGDALDEITSLACSDGHLMTACKDAAARIYSHPGDEFEGFLSRSAGVPIRWVSVDKQGERVAICGDDLLVKIVDVNDREKVQSLSDNPKSVRSAAWDPTGQYLVTAGCDGKVKIYDMTGNAPLHLKIMDGIISPSESDAVTSCYACWHPSGKYFAIPLRTHDIGIVNREGWTKQVAFSSDDLTTGVSELAWSPNGRYLASSSGTQILIWASDSRTVIAKYTSEKYAISSLAWSPISNLIAFVSMDGSFSRWTAPIPSDLPSPFATEVQENKRVERLLDDFGDDIDMEDRGEDADLDLDDFLGDEVDVADDWIVDDEGDYGNEKKYGKGRQEVVNVTKAQASFTPGSTVMKNKKRYLAFSMIGAVDVSDQESHNVVNVEFHDKSIRRGYHFQDHAKYSMASMGEQGISYAAGSSSDGPSEIHYRPYDSWASQADWTQSLPAGEDATCIATGGPPEEAGLGHVVVSTSKGFVRFFTASGIQRYIWRLGEDVVSMAAGKEAVFVVHREGGTSLDGCQNLRYTVMDLDTYDILQEGRVPLSKKVTLSWLGWTAEGAPAIFDSTGVLSMLDRYRRPSQARWAPILDTASLRREGRSERHWPVGVTTSHMACAILKGTEKEPWFPRPLLQEVALQMPLLSLDGQTGKLEESMIRGNLLISLLGDIPTFDAEEQTNERRAENERLLLTLVQSACKSDNLPRALDLARMMLNPTTVEAAAQVAVYYHLHGLADRMGNLRGESKGRAKKAEKLERERAKEMERRFPADHALPSNGGGGGGGKRGSEVGFAPRAAAAKRSFGGNKRAETPSYVSTGRETIVPETPNADDESIRFDEYEDTGRATSPGEKRKRREEEDLGFAAPTKKRGEEFAVPAEPKKNPFLKKPAAASNPFAKPAVPASRALDNVKSTSFYDRVDQIESSGAPKSKPKQSKAAKANGTSGSGGKQTTLLGMKKAKPVPKPQPVHADSMASTDTEDTQMSIMETDTGTGTGAEETQEDLGSVVAETQMDEPAAEVEEEESENIVARETMMSPDPEEGAEEVYL